MYETSMFEKQEEFDRHADSAIQSIVDKLPDTRVLVKGFLPDFVVPTEAHLIAHGKKQVEDIITPEKRSVQIAPTRLTSRLKNFRRSFYLRLKRVSFILGKGAGGRNAYLIPYDKIGEFMDFIEELNEELKSIETEINAYLQGKTTEDDRKFLENARKFLEKNKDVYQKDIPQEVQLSLRVTYSPLEITPETFKQIATEEIRNLTEEAKQKLEKIFEESRKQYIKWMLADLERRFAEILQKLTKSLETKYSPRLDSIESAIEETLDLARSVNLDSVIEDLANAVSATAQVVCAKKYSESDLKKATAHIARALNIDSDNPSEILKKATYDLIGMDRRVAEVVRRM